MAVDVIHNASGAYMYIEVIKQQFVTVAAFLPYP